MSNIVRRRTVIKKRAKPLADVHSSLLHQAIKLVSKTVKVVKAFMVQKCTRRLTELKESNNDIKSELELLAELKSIDHSLYGTVVANNMLSIGKKDLENNQVNGKLLKAIMEQKKIIEVINDIQNHIVEAVAKNNDRRADEQRREAKQAKKAKNLLEKRSISKKDRTSAVFVDSLETSPEKPEKVLSKKEQKAIEQVKIQKSLRNKQNRINNKAAKQSSNISYSSQNTNRKPKRKFSEHTDSSENLSIYGPGVDSNKKKRSDVSCDSKIVKSAPVVPVVENLEKCVASGKDWKESGLHPSWAAKQLSKNQPLVISAGATSGKKITFD